jgi:hypothetical protein
LTEETTMGDRANVCVKDRDGGAVFFYTHWAGYDLPRTVAAGLARGKDRWGDTAYLARILFCEMVKGDPGGEKGYGISTCVQDNQGNRPILVVDDGKSMVGIATEADPTEPYQSVTYEEFIEDPGRLPWS